MNGAPNNHEYHIKLAFQQSQKLDALDLLARNLIHELKNCLGGVSGAAELLEIDADDTKSVRDLTKVIMSSTDNAIQAINTLTDFLHQTPDQSEQYDAHDFFEKQMKFYTACLSKQIPIELICEARNPQLRCDPLLLAHTAMNIVINARESIDERGKVSINTSDRKIAENERGIFQAVKPGQYFDICFSDTGCGIDQQVLSDVCNTGFSDKQHHAGMGLSLADEFMRQNAGYLCVESGKNVGTKVHLLFPQ